MMTKGLGGKSSNQRSVRVVCKLMDLIFPSKARYTERSIGFVEAVAKNVAQLIVLPGLTNTDDKCERHREAFTQTKEIPNVPIKEIWNNTAKVLNLYLVVETAERQTAQVLHDSWSFKTKHRPSHTFGGQNAV